MKVTSPYCEILKLRAWQAILLSPPIKCDQAFLSGTFPVEKPIPGLIHPMHQKGTVYGRELKTPIG